jgi:hypothetical protein
VVAPCVSAHPGTASCSLHVCAWACIECLTAHHLSQLYAKPSPAPQSTVARDTPSTTVRMTCKLLHVARHACPHSLPGLLAGHHMCDTLSTACPPAFCAQRPAVQQPHRRAAPHLEQHEQHLHHVRAYVHVLQRHARTSCSAMHAHLLSSHTPAAACCRLVMP